MQCGRKRAAFSISVSIRNSRRTSHCSRCGVSASMPRSLFSDILVIPLALGRKLWFVEGEGPRLEPLADAKAAMSLRQEADQKLLSPIYETVRRVKSELGPQDDIDRLLRRAVDRCDLYGRRPRDSRSGAGEKTGALARLRRFSMLSTAWSMHRLNIWRGNWKPAPTWCRYSIPGQARCRRRISSAGACSRPNV